MENSLEKEIIEKLKNEMILDNPPVINQIQFDLLVDKLIKNDEKELMWRLCGSYNGYNFNKVIEYFIKEKDSYYLEKLVCFTGGELDQKFMVEKMLETQDKLFIRNALEECGKSMQYSMNDDLLEQLLDYIKIYPKSEDSN